MAITLRNTKGSALTFAELDGNFSDLDTRVDAKLDSALTIQLIDANALDSNRAIGLIDSAYVQSRVDASASLDSAEALQLITTNYGSIGADLIPALDSTYDLGSASNKWKDLHLSGQTINLGGQTIKSLGGKFEFSQELSTGPNNISVDSGNGFFVNTYANIATATQTGAYAAQANSMKVEGNTIQFTTVDGIPSAEVITNQNIFLIGDPVNGGGAAIVPNATIAQRNAVQARSKFKTGAILYQTDSNSFEFYDSDGWQKFIKLDTLKTEVAASADFAAFKTRIAAL